MPGVDESGTYAWTFQEPDAAVVRELSRTLNRPEWFAALLVQRGLGDPERATAWLNPLLRNLGDPFLLPDAEKAAARILLALERKERITLFGDYDVDGMTSVTLLHDLLSRTGVPVSTFLPLRMEEGYGLSTEALERCLEEQQPNLIITVDCGTSSVEAVALAVRHGIDVIITDHHDTGAGLAPALAVVNPRRSENAEMHVLCGVGVAFKLAHAVLKLGRIKSVSSPWVQTDPKEFLDLVALGTVADLVPLLHENRILVHHGLKALNRTRRPGLRALAEVAKITTSIDTYEVGFLIGPRLNASGRLGNARKSLQLLMTDDPSEAVRLAAELDAANKERQQVEKSIVEELKARLGTAERVGHGIVEAEADWHPGVIGIVASRLVQQFHRPAIVIGMDDLGRAKGSCRSIPGFNILRALDACRDLLVKHGGHAMAAGLEIAWDRIPEFRKRFDAFCRTEFEGRDLKPRLALDGSLEMAQVNEEAISLLDSLRPFGMGHPEPVWAVKDLMLAEPPRQVGQGHLKLRLIREGNEREAIGFGMFHRTVPERLDGAVQLRLDTFRGRRQVVMHLKDFRPSSHENA